MIHSWDLSPTPNPDKPSNAIQISSLDSVRLQAASSYRPIADLRRRLERVVCHLTCRTIWMDTPPPLCNATHSHTHTQTLVQTQTHHTGKCQTGCQNKPCLEKITQQGRLAAAIWKSHQKLYCTFKSGHNDVGHDVWRQRHWFKGQIIENFPLITASLHLHRSGFQHFSQNLLS